MSQTEIEAVGKAFDVTRMLEVRERTRDAVNAIAARVAPGMLEEDAGDMARTVLAELGLLRGWHGIYVRFGPNTVKSYGEPSAPGVTLGDNDLFFIDIGPVWEQWEGDAGDTFVVGRAPEFERCAADAQALFHTVRRQWMASGMSGKALYEFATEEAKALGWALNLGLAGHRLSDFPHAAIHRGPMATIDFKPKPLIWVLEIHIRDPKSRFGAFFEDMLLDDSHFPAAPA